MNFQTNVTCFVYTLLVGRLGLGARSWVRVELAEKVVVSVSSYSVVFPPQLRGGVASPQ